MSAPDAPLTVGWGIVGLGGIAGREIAPAIAKATNSRLVAGMSRDLARARDFAQQHGARAAYDDYEALLRDPEVTAVYIATPNAMHADQAIAAARAGKHVLCDKPLATSVVDAQQVVEVCEAEDVRLGLVFQSRNHDGMAQLKDVIAGGEIGTPIVAQYEMGAGRTLLRGWRTDPLLAGVGTMHNLGVHGYDLLTYLLGDEVAEVSTFTGVEEGFVLETLALSLLRFESGAFGYVNVNQSVPHPSADLSIHGTEGRIVGVDVTRMNKQGRLTITGRSRETVLEAGSFEAYLRTISDFSDAVLTGREPAISGADGLRSAKVVAAMSRSSAERRVVPVGA